ncbi:hypothetical protein V6N13_095300 [Hibiscus sabdariffa]
MFIGFCEVFGAELWGVWSGLQMAWAKGFRRIIIEVDSLDVVRVLQEDRRQGHICTLILHIQMLLRRSWEVHVLHVLRRDNSVADGLAKLTNLDSTCVMFF